MAFVTFDLFSALIDSRTGGAAALAGIGGGRGWRLGADAVYDDWDARNKASQKSTAEWVPFAEHCRRALADTYRALDLPGDRRRRRGAAAGRACPTGRSGRTSRTR